MSSTKTIIIFKQCCRDTCMPHPRHIVYIYNVLTPYQTCSIHWATNGNLAVWMWAFICALRIYKFCSLFPINHNAHQKQMQTLDNSVPCFSLCTLCMLWLMTNSSHFFNFSIYKSAECIENYWCAVDFGDTPFFDTYCIETKSHRSVWRTCTFGTSFTFSTNESQQQQQRPTLRAGSTVGFLYDQQIGKHKQSPRILIYGHIIQLGAFKNKRFCD